MEFREYLTEKIDISKQIGSIDKILVKVQNDLVDDGNNEKLKLVEEFIETYDEFVKKLNKIK